MAGALRITVGGTALPDNVTSLKRSDELLWSDGTGRAADNGVMTGSVVAKKQTYTVEFGPLTASQYATVRGVAGSGFAQLVVTVNGSRLADISVYRGTVEGSLMGVYGGEAWYGGVTLELVEK